MRAFRWLLVVLFVFLGCCAWLAVGAQDAAAMYLLALVVKP